jgi:aminoglycoside phosphotransferase (APT) family kinase protein
MPEDDFDELVAARYDESVADMFDPEVVDPNPVPKMHADEVDVDAALVRRLLTAQFPRWADTTIEPVLPRGTDNALYRLGRELVARLPRHERTVATLLSERRCLPTLAPLLPVAIPMPVAEGGPGEGYPFKWSIYRWLRGEPATSDRIDDPIRFAEELAGFVGAMQRVDRDGPSPGAHNFLRGVPLAQRDEGTRAAIAALEGKIDDEAVTAAWEKALSAPDWNRPAVWIHGDLDARNLLVEDGRLSGVIDFGCVGVGDPACDVAVAWKMLTPRARDVFRTSLGVDDATWERSRGWVLSQALMALSYYTLETNAVLVREAERWLSEVLSDPE